MRRQTTVLHLLSAEALVYDSIPINSICKCHISSRLKFYLKLYYILVFTMGGKSSKAVGRDETITNHTEEFGTRHSMVNSSGFHPSIIELHAPSAGMGILPIIFITLLLFAAMKVASMCMRHRGHHRALRHYYHVREVNNNQAPLYPCDPRQEAFLHAQQQFQEFRRPPAGMIRDQLQVV